MINDVINTVSGERSKPGAIQNRLEHTIANLATSVENLTVAESRIRDVDIAVEMMNFTKHQMLSQASTAMLVLTRKEDRDNHCQDHERFCANSHRCSLRSYSAP